MACRAAHELKNPLNGLALNLEVVRSRSTRAGVDGASLAPFAAAAAAELERSLSLVDALLSLARPLALPVDLRTAARPLATLYGAVARALGGSLAVAESADQTIVPVEGPTTRVLLAEVLDAAVGSERVVAGVFQHSAAGVAFRLDCGLTRPVGKTVERLAAESGIRLEAGADETILLFPALARTGADANT